MKNITNELDKTCGISDEELTRRFKEAVRIENDIKRVKGVPIPGYNPQTKKAYLIYPNGRIEYVGK
ncbi:MAG: hypothetical protein PUB76_07915 [Oscillospiraceae bacterium]|nr:hypothetical protein [Oscillospiraceae bacterium]